MNENPFLYDVEDLYDGDFFQRDLTSEKIPDDILNLISPTFAVRFEIIPVGFDSYGIFYLATTAKNVQPLNSTTLLNLEIFFGDKWDFNCRILVTDEKNIQNALEKYYNFSDELLKKSLIEFYDFDRLAFNDYEKMRQYAIKNSGRIIKNSLIEPPLSDAIKNVVDLVPAKLAINYSLIPVELEENGIFVLLTSSSRTFDSAKIFSEILGKPCRIFLSVDENIRSALEKFYNFDGLVRKFSNKTDFDYLIEGSFVNWEIFDRKIPPEILEKVPLKLAIKFNLIPLGFDSEQNLVLVSSAPDSLKFKKEISTVLKSDCKIILTDTETFFDALSSIYDFEEIFPEPFGNWARLRYKFLIFNRPEELLDLKNSGEYENYFEKLQTNSESRLDFFVKRQLERENISEDNFGIVENVRAGCREILTQEICS